MITLAPCSLSSSAVARPMPRAEPVTIATLSSRTPMREHDSRKSSYKPYERPITSSMISSVPAPIRFRRRSRQARSIWYSRM